MKLVFAHDHKLRYIDGKYYTLGGLSDEITGRYLAFFDTLTIFCRAIPKQSFDTQLFELKNPAVTVKPVSEGSLVLTKRAKKLMESEIKEADALIVKLHSKIAEHAIHYARKYNVPYLVESIGCPWDAYWNSHHKAGKLVAPIMMMSTKRELKRAPFAVYVTKEFLERRYPCDGRWIDCSDVELQETDQTVLDKRLDKIRANVWPLVIGTLGQVDVLYKGQEYVIRAISELKKKGLIFRYLLAGSGSPDYLKGIAQKEGVEDQVEFCGVLPHDKVFSWLDEIDFYIQPSKQEGLPRAMIEALSRGCPAAGSNVGGIGELVDKEYIFKKGNVESIVGILEGLTKEKLEIMAVKNFDTARKYEKAFLDKKRYDFYKEFANYCQTKKASKDYRNAKKGYSASFDI